MDYRTIIYTLILCLLLTSPGAGQESIFFPQEPDWGNPYPGLGNVAPGSVNPSSSKPSAVMLYADDDYYTALSPTEMSTELYLSRFPSKKRDGAFQKVNFNTLWAPSGGKSGLGMTELDLSAMFALPLPTRDSPLLITPKFAATFLDSKDWDETFYTTGLSLRWIRPIVKDKLTADLGASVYYSGDFRVRTNEAIRVPLHLAGIWNFNPRIKIVLGVVYADRRDGYNIFPMGGIIWTPNDDVSVELLMPRVRIAQRIRWFGSAAGDEQSDWLYTAMEFGSGTWGYDRIDGRAEYRDIRLLLGYERRTRIGLTLGLEVGLMCDRKMYLEKNGSWEPSESVFLRFRSSF